MLLVANLADTNRCIRPQKWLKPWHMGAHWRALSESSLMDTNMTWLIVFQKSLHSCALDKSGLSIWRVKIFHVSMLLPSQGKPADNAILLLDNIGNIEPLMYRWSVYDQGNGLNWPSGQSRPDQWIIYNNAHGAGNFIGLHTNVSWQSFVVYIWIR